MQLFFFLPIILFFAFFGLLIVGFLFIVFKIVVKTKASSWTGKVTEKLFKTEKEDDSPRKTNYFTLVVLTDDGQTRKIAVSKDLYDSCQVGDKLEKPKGKLNPEKVQ